MPKGTTISLAGLLASGMLLLAPLTGLAVERVVLFEKFSNGW
jgi:hypothetical protein